MTTIEPAESATSGACARELTDAQRHAFGVIGGVAFGMERRALTGRAKELARVGLVATDGAHSGQNRGTYFWRLTKEGEALLVKMVKAGAYPLAACTEAGRALLGAA